MKYFDSIKVKLGDVFKNKYHETEMKVIEIKEDQILVEFLKFDEYEFFNGKKIWLQNHINLNHKYWELLRREK